MQSTQQRFKGRVVMDASLLRDSVGAIMKDLGGQTFTVTQDGPSPFAVDFEALGISDVPANYTVVIQGNPDSRVLQASISSTGFTIAGGVEGDVHHVVLSAVS